MGLFVVHCGGEYCSGKTETLKSLEKLLEIECNPVLGKFLGKKVLTTELINNIVGENAISFPITNGGKSGGKIFEFENVYFLIFKEWVSDYTGFIDHSKLIGSKNKYNPIVGQSAFAIQPNLQFFLVRLLANSLKKDIIQVNDISFWDTVKAYTPYFQSLGAFEGEVTEKDVADLKNVLNINISHKQGMNRYAVINDFFNSPMSEFFNKNNGLTNLISKRYFNFLPKVLDDHKPDHYFRITASVDEIMRRVENRMLTDPDRSDSGEDDPEYATAIQCKISVFLDSVKENGWNHTKIDTTNISSHKASELLLDGIINNYNKK
ncbi:MAG: hypothetical protein GON13_03565 [Nanoarchaeota archaeon]|nr:hypothetical protein [Nanoarchaeota archaeon]